MASFGKFKGLGVIGWGSSFWGAVDLYKYLGSRTWGRILICLQVAIGYLTLTSGMGYDPVTAVLLLTVGLFVVIIVIIRIACALFVWSF